MKPVLTILASLVLGLALWYVPELGLQSRWLWMLGFGLFVALCLTIQQAPLSFHFVVGWALVLLTLRQVCTSVPPYEKELGVSYLIFYYHFPSAISCLVLFLIAGGISVKQLLTGSLRTDVRAASAVEVGVLACCITLGTGMIWAEAAWGQPWDWRDSRLVTVAIMCFMYLAYLMFRLAIDNPLQRARFASVLGILFALNVPVVWYSIKWFGQVSHPRELEMVGENRMLMKYTQWFGAVGFFLLYQALWRLRFESAWLDTRLFHLSERFVRHKI